MADERSYYDNVANWARTASDEEFDYRWSPLPGVGYGNLHADSEADDLWTWEHQAVRWAGETGFNVNGMRNNWRNWYLSNYLNALDASDGDSAPSGYGYDHMYGQGVAQYYRNTGNSAALAVLDGLRSRIQGRSKYQQLASGSPIAMAYWEPRATGRWTIVAAYAAEATGDPAWQTIRDNLAFGWETSTDWEEGGVIAAGGMYFGSREQSQYADGVGGIAAYDSGRRYQSTFQIGIAAEAMWRCYMQTQSSILRDRLIKMAQYVKHYAYRPSWNYPNVGSRFGHEGNGSYFHSSPGDGSATSASKDCSYDISIVNLMVIGYKLTGNATMLDFARKLFLRGAHYDPGNGSLRAPLDEVWKFVDTQGVGGEASLSYNKGQLQYMYLLFENGGNPEVLT